jgi:hypothetical protein
LSVCWWFLSVAPSSLPIDRLLSGTSQ